MRIKHKKRGRPQKRTLLIKERTKRTYIDQNGKERPWTQNYVAQQMERRFGKKITASHIGMIERGTNNPSIEVAELLSILFDKSIEDILS